MPPSRPPRSLSLRLFWVTVLLALMIEALVFLPGLGRARRTWLAAHVAEAHIAVLSAAAAPGGVVATATRDELLRLSGTEMVRLIEPGGETLALPPTSPITPARTVDLRTEPALTGIRRAVAALTARADQFVLVTDASPYAPTTVVELIVRQSALTGALRAYAGNAIGLSLLIAIALGAFVYVALHVLLVRPIRRITSSIADFRADPERTHPLDPAAVSLLPDDEMAIAGRELAAMQRDLRGALWRNARLAALGTAMAKVSHDLRNVLSPALLVAGRLEMHPDPSVQRAGAITTTAVDTAADMVRAMLHFAREGAPPPPALTPVDLAALIDAIAPAIPALAIANRLPPATSVRTDQTQLLRVLANLLRNAAEAGAPSATIALDPAPPETTTPSLAILIADTGPGLPEAISAHLFQPFVAGGRPGGTGLGLAIAADLMRVLGGELTLAETGPAGTVFRLVLPTAAALAPPRLEQPIQRAV